MGMTIDESLEWLVSRKEHYEMDDNCQELAQALEVAIDTMRKYQQLKADYETRLKADMVSMLTDIQLEIEDEAWKQGCASNNDREDEAYKIYYFIQQKIDTLKAERIRNEKINTRRT